MDWKHLVVIGEEKERTWERDNRKDTLLLELNMKRSKIKLKFRMEQKV